MESAQAIRQLNEMIGQLLSLGAEDFQELAQISKAIEDWCQCDDCPQACRPAAGKAAEQIKLVIFQEVPDPDGTLAEIANMLGALQEAMADGAENVALEQATSTEGGPVPAAPEEEAPPSATETVEKPQQQAEQTEDDVDGSLPDDADLELLGEFISESREYIENAEAALLTLETDPDDEDAVNTIFRGFHTIKGTSGFLGLVWLSKLTHHAETLLSRVRDNEIRCTGGYADLALRSVDMVKDLIQQVQDALGGDVMVEPEGYDDLMQLLADPEGAGITDEVDDIRSDPPRVGDILVAEGVAQREEIEAAAAGQGKRPIGEAIVRAQAAPVTEVAKALRTQRRISGVAADSSVRVRTDRLDKLNNMVGELVITQSMVSRDVETAAVADQRLARNMSQLGKITRELQEVSLSMRMVPVHGVFQKMARLVRDLARKAGKQVEFVTDGAETELDRNVVEQIGDPLVHMVRNAADHGIETPEEREKAGKPAKGRVELRAFHQAGSVVIEVEDDGKGLDKERVLQKAIAKGIVKEGQELGEQDVCRLVFHPGLSTAETVTDISGRGVGMDVVRKNIESLRGRVDIASTRGVGSVFTIRLPLTLAVIDGQVIKVGRHTYIIPTTSIERCLRPEAEQLTSVQNRGEMVTVRGELMPMFRLYKLFGVEPRTEIPTESLVVIVESDSEKCCLMVDELLGQQQVVIKNLGSGLGEVPGVSGGAIMGNGNVSLILDVPGLIKLARENVA
ncbi:MAG: chemotaxis protein CheA [Planctomycetes bacterium]|nr:chemotaxis protein CheA [Planctomycetota bacterium]